MLSTLIIEKMWNNVEFWQVLFITIIVSLVLVKLFFIIDKKVGVFQNYKQYDLGIYKKTSAFFAEDDFNVFLSELLENIRYKKSSLQQIGDFESLMSSTSNTYKSEILQNHIHNLLSHISFLKRFLIVNFAEDISGNLTTERFLTLLPETQRILSDQKKQQLFSEDENAKDLMEEKKSFYFQKERELKELTQNIKNEYSAYRDTIKRYLNV